MLFSLTVTGTLAMVYFMESVSWPTAGADGKDSEEERSLPELYVQRKMPTLSATRQFQKYLVESMDIPDCLRLTCSLECGAFSAKIWNVLANQETYGYLGVQGSREAYKLFTTVHKN